MDHRVAQNFLHAGFSHDPRHGLGDGVFVQQFQHGALLDHRASLSIWGVLDGRRRSEEHTSELQSLMRISYAVFCLKKKTKQTKSMIQMTKYKSVRIDAYTT